MMTETNTDKTVQKDMFKPLLRDIISMKHPLVRLADEIDWKSFDEGLRDCFCPDNGRPSSPVRLMVALQYLKFAFDLSDEAVLEEWVENPYWQYFTGGIYFEHEPPANQSTMSRWRAKLQKAGAEKMLQETIRTGLKVGFIRRGEFRRVNVDTTVQEKNIRFPTDARLYDRMRERLVAGAARVGIVLRQSYRRIAKKTLRAQGGYSKAKQYRRAGRATRKLRTFLGRVMRDIRRVPEKIDGELSELLGRADRLLSQGKTGPGKLYSVHEPQVECICKGKAGKRYEFGTKVGIVSTSGRNWIVGAEAYPGNPYDGHTLRSALAQAERLLGLEPEMAVCDLGYRGHNYTGKCDIQVVNRYRKHPGRTLRFWWNRRSAVEPVIGHCKSDNRLERNYLKGKLGDGMNVVLSAAGFNLRKLLKAFRFLAAIFRAMFLAHFLSDQKKRISFLESVCPQHKIPALFGFA